MKKPRVYLDTTIPSAFLDERAPDRKRLTEQFWDERLPAYEPVISTIVLKEIQDTPDSDKSARMERMVASFDILEFDEEARALAREYVSRGIFTEKYESDANHVAVAVVNGIGFFASWNFSHLVKVSTRREVNLVNALLGYGVIEIVAPPEL
jgi:hypothetical protein